MLDNFLPMQSTNPQKDIRTAKVPGVFVVITPSDGRTYLVLAAQSNKPLTVLAWDQNGEIHNAATLPGNIKATITRIEDEALREYIQATSQAEKGTAAGR